MLLLPQFVATRIKPVLRKAQNAEVGDIVRGTGSYLKGLWQRLNGGGNRAQEPALSPDLPLPKNGSAKEIELVGGLFAGGWLQLRSWSLCPRVGQQRRLSLWAVSLQGDGCKHISGLSAGHSFKGMCFCCGSHYVEWEHSCSMVQVLGGSNRTSGMLKS
eukprot:scaffold107430_cov22-Tisochrysis_lutea.AAC.1